MGMTQESLAALLGLSFSTINRWETDEGASGPKGTVLTVLEALEEGLRRDPALPARLASWLRYGQPYAMQKLFSLAFSTDPRKGHHQ
jgi:transcriptional regulator with XRE-family HTH domain